MTTTTRYDFFKWTNAATLSFRGWPIVEGIEHRFELTDSESPMGQTGPFFTTQAQVERAIVLLETLPRLPYEAEIDRTNRIANQVREEERER